MVNVKNGENHNAEHNLAKHVDTIILILTFNQIIISENL